MFVVSSSLGAGVATSSAVGTTASSAGSAAASRSFSVKLSPQCSATHRVLPNDSWTRLAARFKVPQSRLLRINSASLTTPLFVGDKVCLTLRSSSSAGEGSTGGPGTTTSTTTTTTIAAVATAPTVTVAEPVACRPIEVSWSGASPDTGLYSLQWVRVSASDTYDFRDYTMWNVRGTSTALPNWLAHGATYALRVYAMRADWDGLTHSNQNVTPHSAIVSFTLPSCNPPTTTITSSTTTTVSLTCAQGGACAVGDTGPGGGVVFILASTAGNTTGLTFEAARNDWDGASPDGTARWCSASNASIPGLGTAIGTGSSNSATIASTCSSTGALDAAEYVRGKTIGGKNDWFLPSRDEALEIYSQRSVFTGNYAINQLSVDTARYLTSSQGTNVLNSLGAYLQGSSFPGTSQDLSKNFNFSIRPVRSFTAGS